MSNHSYMFKMHRLKLSNLNHNHTLYIGIFSRSITLAYPGLTSGRGPDLIPGGSGPYLRQRAGPYTWHIRALSQAEGRTLFLAVPGLTYGKARATFPEYSRYRRRVRVSV